jgi:uncharacterized membrane protein YeaQ/YmgE (transglycosylase-associated protein family)
MRIVLFFVFGSILVLLVFGIIAGGVSYLLVPGRGRRSGFKSMAIGEAGSVVGGLVAGALSWLLPEPSRRGR